MSGLRSLVRALGSPFMMIGRSYNETAKRYPMMTGVVTTVLKTSAADLMAQKVVERREKIDWRRNGLFTFFGFAYLGCFQYWLYNDLFVRICKPITAVVGHYGSAPVKTFIDQCIHHPLFYFPAFYVCKGSVEGRPIASSMEKYQEDLWENCKALWMVWVPAQMVNFAVVPLHLRIPFVAAVSFGWTVIISVMRGSLESVPVEDPAEVPIKVQATLFDHQPHTQDHVAPSPSPSSSSSLSAALPVTALASAPAASRSSAARLESSAGHEYMGPAVAVMSVAPAAQLTLAAAAAAGVGVTGDRDRAF